MGRPGDLGVELDRILRAGEPTGIRIGTSVAVGLLICSAVVVVVSFWTAEPTSRLSWAIGGLIVLTCIALAAWALAGFLFVAIPPFLLRVEDRAALATVSWAGARAARRVCGSPFRFIQAIHSPITYRVPPIALFTAYLLGHDYAAAERVIERFPADSAWDSFVRAEAVGEVRLGLGLSPDWPTIDAACSALTAGERTEALVRIAIIEATNRIPSPGWKRPLLVARKMIPESDWSILMRDRAWPLYQLLAQHLVRKPLARRAFVSIVVIGMVGVATMVAASWWRS